MSKRILKPENIKGVKAKFDVPYLSIFDLGLDRLLKMILKRN